MSIWIPPLSPTAGGMATVVRYPYGMVTKIACGKVLIRLETKYAKFQMIEQVAQAAQKHPLRPMDQSFNVSRILKIVVLIVLLAILIAPAFVGYFGRFTIVQLRILTFSIYGIYSLVNFILQVVFASINRYRMHNAVVSVDAKPIGVAILVVGYREDPFMFRKCLESVIGAHSGTLIRRICVIDGNDASCQEMAKIGTSVFGVDTIALDHLIMPNDGEVTDKYGLGDCCITQPHNGKRNAMYTGFRILLNDPRIDAIVTIDSDTIIDHNAPEHLVTPMHNDDEIGAVAGEINVWNTDTLLSFLTSLRYWNAFNLERASSSFLRCVMCCGGPLACYRTTALRQIVDKWLEQRFLGKPCTFGDDRHLTNCILGTGMRVVYTQRATCQTDSPTDFISFMNQQTRWSKSYFREIFYSLACLDRQNFWLGWELFYRTLYFFLVSFWAMYLLYFASIKTQAIALITMTAFSIVRTLFGVIIMRDARFLFFTLYVFIYFFMIIPTKITALLTMRETGWGTRGTFAGELKRFTSTIVAIIWFLAVLGGVALTIYRNYTFQWSLWNYRFAFITLMVYLVYIISCLVAYFMLQRLQLLRTQTLDWLRVERTEREKLAIDSNLSIGEQWEKTKFIL